MKISFSKSFKKNFKKKIKNYSELEEKFWNKIELFIENPYNPNLMIMKMQYFADIGTHTEVY
ncbi:MAG: hypothetical protein ABI840_09790 [bacterium]